MKAGYLVRMLPYYWGSECRWLRLSDRGYGLMMKCSTPLFSERYGYRKPFARLGKWRFFVLKKEKET